MTNQNQNQQQLHGRFFFKKTDNGNLIGEFSNNLDPRIYSESADLIKGCEEKDKGCVYCRYHGTYSSTWQENGSPFFADLTISKNTRNDKLFSLKWIVKNGSKDYTAEGMLCDGILIGDYHPA
jgi:hypothetical protein